MCFFISIIVKGGDAQAIDLALRRHGRRAKPLDNASMRLALQIDEVQFLTTVGHCDCGTALSQREHVGERQKSQTSKYIAKLKNKGWSATKIDRWIADRAKAGERAEERHQSNAPDSLELWTQIIYDVMAVDDVEQAGLLLHFYSGDVENEVFQPTRKSVSTSDFASELRSIKEDQLLIATSDSS